MSASREVSAGPGASAPDAAPAPDDGRVLAPGDQVGVLGGGQLARMLCLAAAPLGLRVHVYNDEPDAPAFDVCAARTVAPYDDERALRAFAASVSVVTYEFENVPAATAALLASLVPVRPGPRALAAAQDRLVEKRFLAGLGLPLAPFAPVDDAASLAVAIDAMGLPAVLKTRRLGYDGKGQRVLRVPGEAPAALAAMGGAASVLEGFVPFAREVSVVAARGRDGAFAPYEVNENVHEHHVLARTTLPARIAPATAAAAIAAARAVADALGYVGVLAVEMFVVGEGPSERLVINEIAPRVHNSGHWTLEGARASQFEQHLRAVAGWPLGDPARLGAIRMDNLVGEGVHAWPALLAEPGAHLHLYGKREARPGRKMGHVTRVTPGA